MHYILYNVLHTTYIHIILGLDAVLCGNDFCPEKGVFLHLCSQYQASSGHTNAFDFDLILFVDIKVVQHHMAKKNRNDVADVHDKSLGNLFMHLAGLA